VRGVRAVLEVRHASWLDPAALERLRAAGVALCLADWRLPPVTGPLTADFVYVRRHGTREGYGGAYGERALRTDARAVRRWRRQGRDVYVYFNNDRNAFAVLNARRLAELVGRNQRRRP